MPERKLIRPFERIQQCRERKMRRLVGNVMAEQSEIPAFIKSLENVSKKKKKMSILFFTLLFINLTVCVLQTGERIWYYLTEPTTVDAYLIEISHGAFPNVYFFPRTTQEFNNFYAATKGKGHTKDYCMGIIELNANDKYTMQKKLKYLRILNYITDAYISTGKLRWNLTIQNLLTLKQPVAKISSPLQLQFGNVNSKMVIKLKFPKVCHFVEILIDLLPAAHLTYKKPVEIHLKKHVQSGRVLKIIPIHTVAATTVKKYNFINTKRNPCDDNIIGCLHTCFMKNITCSSPFYETGRLPKCNKTQLIHQYWNVNNITHLPNVTKYCKCIDVCKVKKLDIVYEEFYASRPSLDVIIVSNNVPTLHERISYDIISLLCDIGGNIGLYFGMSCLMLVEILLYGCKIPFMKFRKMTRANSNLKHKIETILEKNQKTSKKSTVQRKLKNLVFLILIVMSIYNVHNQISNYFDFPLVKTVSLVRDDIIHFPLIVNCPDSKKTYRAKDKLARTLHTDCSNYQLFDLLHPKSQFANNSLQLWKESLDIDGAVMKAENGITVDYQHYQQGNPKFVNRSYVSTAFGICTAFQKYDEPYIPKENSLTFTDGIGRNVKCGLHQPNFIVPQNQFFHPKHIFYRPDSNKIDISRQTLIRVNTPKNPCQTNQLVTECEEKYFKTKVDQQSFTCKLPFMEKSSVPYCEDHITAKRTTKQYLETQFNTDPVKDCSCSARCEETIFIPSIIKQIDNLEIQYSIDSNIREVIAEQEVISVVKLLCQIGSIIGILTGLSIFTLVEISFDSKVNKTTLQLLNLLCNSIITLLTNISFVFHRRIENVTK